MQEEPLRGETLILGGGISGLAVAHYLGGDCTVLEAAETPGGLCRSYAKDGFVYDIGGHILFSKNPEVLGEMMSWLGDNVHQRRRNNQIWYKDRFVKYPFENGLAVLEKEEILEILLTFLRRPEMVPQNLHEWCHARFGKGLAEKYLIPYNEKIWKRDLRDMSLHWVERVPSPPMEDVLRSAIGIETEGYTFQLNFHYPKQGGYESVIRGLADKVPKIVTRFRAQSVRRKGKQWEVSDGTRTFTGERLISTIPVFDLMGCLEKVPDTVQTAVAGLQYNPMLVVMVGVNHEGLSDRTAIYLPDPKVLAHRVCYMKYFSEANGPTGCSHLIAEITVPPGDPLLSASDDAITARVINDLKDICGFTANEVVATEVRRIPYAYPVYDMSYSKNTETYYAYLDAQEIQFTGRFAAFKYVNSDKCVEMAKSLAAAMRARVSLKREWSHL